MGAEYAFEKSVSVTGPASNGARASGASPTSACGASHIPASWGARRHESVRTQASTTDDSG